MASTVILITGANSGVGFAAAKVLAAASPDYHVVISGRSQEKIEKALSELKASSLKGTLSAIQLDVTSQKSIQQAVKSVEEQFGRLDVLINNAGIASQDPDLEVRYLDTLTTNVIGPVLVAEGFRPLLLKSQNPYSIYISSSLGSLGLAADPASQTYRADYTTYRSSKAALDMVALQDVKLSKATTPNLKIFVFLSWTRCLKSPGHKRGGQECRRPGRGSRSSWKGVIEHCEGRARCRCWKICSQRRHLSVVIKLRIINFRGLVFIYAILNLSKT